MLIRLIQLGIFITVYCFGVLAYSNPSEEKARQYAFEMLSSVAPVVWNEPRLRPECVIRGEETRIRPDFSPSVLEAVERGGRVFVLPYLPIKSLKKQDDHFEENKQDCGDLGTSIYAVLDVNNEMLMIRNIDR